MNGHVCPNGHDFPQTVAVRCAECDAQVACVPFAAFAELLRAADGEALYADELEDRIDQARLLGAKWLRSSEHDVRMMGADLLQVLDAD